MKALMTTITALASLAAATPAFADDVSFAYRNGELASSARLAALYERIADRAEDACSSFGRQTLSARRASAACEAGLVADFVEAIDNPSLSTLHEEDHAAKMASAN